MRLTGFQGKPLIHQGANRDLIEETAIDAGHRQGSSLSAAHDGFSQDVSPIGSKMERRFGFIEYRVKAAAGMRLAPDGVDAAVRPPALGHHHQPIVDSILVKT